jgi:hypothetical protein
VPLAPLASLVQIREYAGTEMAISDPSNDDELQEEVQKAQGRAHQSGCYLDKLHIFVLAHAMRRPIVVYHYDSDQPRGSLISGIYLPDLWGELGHRDVCSRVPLCLVFTGTATGQGHFTACVGAEGHALVLPLSDHVHGERLLIRYGPDHVDIRPSGAATTVAPAGAATLVDTPSAGPTDSWAAQAALHLELTWSAASGSGDLYDEEAKTVAPARVRSFPFAFVSRSPADSRLMLRSVAELRDQFVAEVTRSAVELRTAPDGIAYTKNQFVDFFGGTREWDQAMPTTAPPPPPDTVPFPQVQSPGDLQGLLKGATSMEDLYGIAQNIIRLKLTHYERVQKARDDFHEQCAKFGADEATFSGLFDVCDEALRHADDGECAGGVALAPLPSLDQPDVVRSSSAEELQIALAMSMTPTATPGESQYDRVNHGPIVWKSTANELVAAEKAAAEKVEAEKVEAEKAASEMAASEKAAAEKVEAEKVEAEKAAAEMAASEKAAAEKAAPEASHTWHGNRRGFPHMAWVLNSRVELASGDYGRVVQATETSTGRIASAKVISTSRMKITAIRKEVTLMSKLKHPSIIELLGYEEVPEQTHVVIYMELAAGGQLLSRVITAGILMEDQARVYFKQILEGVGFMHSMGVAHRDLKLENVQVDAHDHCKICDLGLAHEYQVLNGETQVTLLREVCGSKSYCAPEVLEGRGYVGFPVDVWSCGICLFAMLAGFFPLVEADGSDWRYERVKMAAAAQCSATHTIFGFYVRTCTLTTDASDLIDGMLIIDPANRPTIQEVLQGPWCSCMKGGESEREDGRPVYGELGAGLTAAQLEAMYGMEDNGALRRPVIRGGPALGPPPMLCKQEQMFCGDFHTEEHSSASAGPCASEPMAQEATDMGASVAQAQRPADADYVHYYATLDGRDAQRLEGEASASWHKTNANAQGGAQYAGPTNFGVGSALGAGSFTFAPRLQRMVLPALDAAVQKLRDEERAAVAEVRERVLQDSLPLLSLLQVEPLEMQSAHLSFQEYFAARAICTGKYRLPQGSPPPWQWPAFWANAVTLGSEMGDAFGKGLKQTARLSDELDLSKKLIGGDRPTMVAAVVQLMRGLASLSLRENKLTDGEGVKMFAALQTNTTLTHLDLSGNELGAESGKAMGEALKTNTALTQLSLKNNKLGDAGGCALAVALQTNTTLKQLGMGSNSLGADGSNALVAVWKVNRMLTQLDLG